MKAVIHFRLKEKGEGRENNSQPRFKINIKALKEALDGSYMGLGTPYYPIQVDNFIDLKNQEYATIAPNTDITAHLDFKGGNKEIIAMQLVCCKVINIDREHNDGLKGTPGNPWDTIFKLKNNKETYPAPDGTLYIAPNDDGDCCIATRKKIPDAILAYSIVFSATVALDNDNCEKSYYFVLDPVVRISSNQDD
jgi:hypothetical protein